jgi:hypothetical protein
MNKIIGRYLEKNIQEDPDARMVFIGVPRHVGKTTFAMQFLPEYSGRHPGYLNWDNPKAQILWRNILKKVDITVYAAYFKIVCLKGDLLHGNRNCHCFKKRLHYSPGAHPQGNEHKTWKPDFNPQGKRQAYPGSCAVLYPDIIRYNSENHRGYAGGN